MRVILPGGERMPWMAKACRANVWSGFAIKRCAKPKLKRGRESKRSLRALGAEIVHEGWMDGGLALFACVANALGNRTETSDEAGQEIAVEKFMYGTHGSSLILFFVSRQHIFCPGCRNNGQFSMTVMRQCMAGERLA